ncbi:MAG: CBS domain-containing protein [Chloroflexota bacterium]
MTSFNAKVSEWMTTPVVSVSPSTTLIEADRTMTEYGIRRLPVIENGKLVGIITKGDVREARASTANSLSIWELNYLVARLKVEQVMHGNVLTLTGDSHIADAANLMMNKKISGIPVLNEKQQVIGIITESDIFRMLVQQRENQPA